MSLQDYLNLIKNEENRDYFKKIINWVKEIFPDLDLVIKWNQPMFVYKGTFIISFSPSKKYISSAIENRFLDEYRSDLEGSGFDTSKMIFHIKYNQDIDFELLEKIIREIKTVKENSSKFWL